jgi:hypothetical protein
MKFSFVNDTIETARSEGVRLIGNRNESNFFIRPEVSQKFPRKSRKIFGNFFPSWESCKMKKFDGKNSKKIPFRIESCKMKKFMPSG